MGGVPRVMTTSPNFWLLVTGNIAGQALHGHTFRARLPPVAMACSRARAGVTKTQPKSRARRRATPVLPARGGPQTAAVGAM